MAPIVTVGVASMVLIAYLLWASHGVALRQAEIETQNYAKVIETRIDSMLRRIDGVQAEITRAVPAQAFEPHAEQKFLYINAMLNALVTNFPEALAARIFDPTGQLRYTSGEQPSTPVNIADLGWFREVLSAPMGATVISQTFVGRITGAPIVVVARALHNEGGKVIGIAVVPLRLKVLQKQFEALNMGPGGTISLRRSDNHTLLLRWPHLPDEVNRPLKPSNPVVQMLRAGQTTFNVQITAQTDGVPRIYGVDHLPDSPFYLVVGMATDSALAQWRQQAITIAALGVLLLTVVGVMLWRLWLSQTQRLQIQNALMESEAHLAGVIGSAQDAIISVDGEHRIVLFNPAAQRMFARTEATTLGHTLDVLLPPQWRASFREHLRAFDTEDTRAHSIAGPRQFFGLRSDGCEFPIEASVSQFQSHEKAHYTAILRDISERNRATAAQGRLLHILDSSHDEVYVFDADNLRFTYVNRGALRNLGYPLEAMQAMTPVDLKPEFTEASFRQLTAPLIRHEQALLHFETIHRRADASLYPVEVHLQLVEHENERVFLAMILDITERRRSEAALLAAKEKAEAVTVELERSNAELEQFAYAASHDLVEPLRSVSSSVQLLKMRYADQLDARAHEFIAHAIGGAERMRTLIGDLLAFSRVTAQKSPPQEFAMDEALDDALQNLEAAIAQSDAKITRTPLPPVVGHITQITQLFQNLIANAVKYRGEKAAVVHIGARREGPNWVFSVVDQGIGIAPQYFERVFELFKRLHTRDEYDGTGIGLSLCKKVVERHGGRIWVESVPGQGSSFYFTLPATTLLNT